MHRSTGTIWLTLSTAICISLGNVCAEETTPTSQQQAQLDEATKLNKQGIELDDQAKYDQAEDFYQRALKIRETILGPDDADVASVLNNLALLYYEQGKYDKAEPLYQRALKIKEKVFGPDHQSLAATLNNLAGLYDDQGKFAEAEPLYQRALKINETALGPDHPDVATNVNNLALLYKEQGKYAQAEPLFQRAIRIDEKARPDDPSLATDLNNLAELYRVQGKYPVAEPLYLRSLKIDEKALGPDHPSVGRDVNNLALLYKQQGKYAQAEPLYQRALKIDEKALGPDHPTLATDLNNLAELYDDQGKFAQAEPLLTRALKIDEKSLGPDHPTVAIRLNNLAGLYVEQGKYAKAEPLFERTIKILEKALGPDHPEVATAVNNLAQQYENEGKYAQAEPLMQRALKIDEKALGSDHPSVGRDLNNLALLYNHQRKYALAEPLIERALKIKEIALGPDHPDVALGLDNLATMQAAQGQWQFAVKNEDQARRVVRRYVARELPALNAKDQLTFLEVTDQGPFHAALSLALNQRGEPGIAEQTSGWLTNGKAVAQEAVTQSMLLVRASDDAKVGATVKQLLDTRRKLAELVMSAPTSGQEQERHKELDQLEAQETDLAKQVAQATGQKSSAEPWVETAAVRKTIPDGGVMVDIARFDVRNFAAKGIENKWLPPHYAAWITPPAGKGDVQIVDLGPADAIDAAVKAVRETMQAAIGGGSVQGQGEHDAEKLIHAPLADLAKLVWEPLAKAFPAGAKEIILSPDSSLWLVPWGALPIDDGKYTIENYNFRYVVSPRDLVQGATADSSGSVKLKPTQPVVMANPDYDLGPAEVKSATRSVLRNVQLAANDELRGLTAGKSASVFPKVGRLPGTEKETAAIKPKLATYAKRQPLTYLDQYATEGVYKALRRPQVLVLSTHGFFFPDQEMKPDERGGTSSDTDQRGGPPALTVDGKPVENPLLRCGLLLAGCNQSSNLSPRAVPQGDGASDDGILTGMEIVGTDLRGTELVVLSACETGLGQVRNGEGVAGLRQAFQLAGAKAVVATLWSIPDKDSSQIMSQFFTNLADGQPKADALRNAQMAQIEAHRSHYNAAHPFFWAAFTLTGN